VRGSVGCIRSSIETKLKWKLKIVGQPCASFDFSRVRKVIQRN